MFCEMYAAKLGKTFVDANGGSKASAAINQLASLVIGAAEGDLDELRAVGVSPLVAHVPGVGRGLQDQKLLGSFRLPSRG